MESKQERSLNLHGIDNRFHSVLKSFIRTYTQRLFQDEPYLSKQQLEDFLDINLALLDFTGITVVQLRECIPTRFASTYGQGARQAVEREIKKVKEESWKYLSIASAYIYEVARLWHKRPFGFGFLVLVILLMKKKKLSKESFATIKSDLKARDIITVEDYKDKMVADDDKGLEEFEIFSTNMKLAFSKSSYLRYSNDLELFEQSLEERKNFSKSLSSREIIELMAEQPAVLRKLEGFLMPSDDVPMKRRCVEEIFNESEKGDWWTCPVSMEELSSESNKSFPLPLRFTERVFDIILKDCNELLPDNEKKCWQKLTDLVYVPTENSRFKDFTRSDFGRIVQIVICDETGTHGVLFGKNDETSLYLAVFEPGFMAKKSLPISMEYQIAHLVGNLYQNNISVKLVNVFLHHSHRPRDGGLLALLFSYLLCKGVEDILASMRSFCSCYLENSTVMSKKLMDFFKKTYYENSLSSCGLVEVSGFTPRSLEVLRNHVIRKTQCCAQREEISEADPHNYSQIAFSEFLNSVNCCIDECRKDDLDQTRSQYFSFQNNAMDDSSNNSDESSGNMSVFQDSSDESNKSESESEDDSGESESKSEDDSDESESKSEDDSDESESENEGDSDDEKKKEYTVEQVVSHKTNDSNDSTEFSYLVKWESYKKRSYANFKDLCGSNGINVIFLSYLREHNLFIPEDFRDVEDYKKIKIYEHKPKLGISSGQWTGKIEDLDFKIGGDDSNRLKIVPYEWLKGSEVLKKYFEEAILPQSRGYLSCPRMEGNDLNIDDEGRCLKNEDGSSCYKISATHFLAKDAHFSSLMETLKEKHNIESCKVYNCLRCQLISVHNYAATNSQISAKDEDNIKMFFEHFQPESKDNSKQNDPSEFFLNVIHGISWRICPEFTSYFSFEYFENRTCLSCDLEFTPDNPVNFVVYPFSLPRQTGSRPRRLKLNALVNSSFEEFDSFQCGVCKTKCDCNVRCRCSTPPSTLILQPLLFQYNKGHDNNEGHFSKTCTFSIEEKITVFDTVYHLHALIASTNNNVESGHHFSFYKTSSGWKQADARRISSVKFEDISQTTPYLLRFHQCLIISPDTTN